MNDIRERKKERKKERKRERERERDIFKFNHFILTSRKS